jgi:hypothetical protein
MDGKYIQFHVIEKKPKTKVYGIYTLNTDDLIGTIKWHPSWRQYCFFPCSETVWSNGCLKDVENFIYQISKEQKEMR